MSIPVNTPAPGARGRALRLGLGVVVAGAALAGAPSLANAASSCAYNPAAHEVVVFDDRAELQFTVGHSISGSGIVIRDDFGLSRECFGGGTVATVFNTDLISVFTQPSEQGVAGDVYRVDEQNGALAPGFTSEADGHPEIEVAFHDRGQPVNAQVIGTAGRDLIRVHGGSLPRVDLGIDGDNDITYEGGLKKMTVFGSTGNDFITGRGTAAPGVLGTRNVNAPLQLIGGAGNDTLVDGAGADQLFGDGSGDTGSDVLFSVDGVKDLLSGGPLVDTATVDSLDVLPNGDIEKRIVGSPVGKLKLTPSRLRAQAGEPAHLKLSWTHPKAWKQLRQIQVNLEHAGETIGTIKLDPHTERTTAGGEVKLAANGTRLTHHGKTVTAQLAVRLPRSMTGEAVRVAVEATDSDGKRQSEPLAGLIRLTK
jgi:hypothetical protein